MEREKSSKDDVKITYNNVMLDLDPSLVSYFRSRGIEELNRKREEAKVSSEKEKSQSKEDI